jgi:uncharacterized membrane protein YiaA
MGLRKKLFDAAGQFDAQLESRIHRLPSWVKAFLCFLLGLVAGEMKLRHKAVFYGLLGLGLLVSFSVLVFTRPKGRK